MSDEKAYLIAVDFGCSSCRCLVVTKESGIIDFFTAASFEAARDIAKPFIPSNVKLGRKVIRMSPEEFTSRLLARKVGDE